MDFDDVMDWLSEKADTANKFASYMRLYNATRDFLSPKKKKEKPSQQNQVDSSSSDDNTNNKAS